MKPIVLAMAGLLLTGAAEAAPMLQRGVGVHEWLNWSPLTEAGDYRWPPYQSVGEWLGQYRPATDWPDAEPLATIRGLGFDFIRLSVDPGPLLASEGARRQEALEVLSVDVAMVLAADLDVVFNLHAVSQVPGYGPDLLNAGSGSAGVQRYREMVADVARMLVRLGTDRVALEPFNEPAYYPCDAGGSEDWQHIMADTVAAIRAVSTELAVVATGACGGGVTGLVDLDPSFDDAGILYSFHMYEPHLFTHQRSDVDGDFASGLPWPASAGSPEGVLEALRLQMRLAGVDEVQQLRQLQAVRGHVESYFAEDWGAAQLEARFDEAVAWAERHGIASARLFVGEFGAMLMSVDGRSGALDADRLRYLEAVRRAAESRGMPWAVWEYSNPFGMSVIRDRGPAVPDGPMLEALGL